jgi:hypothetical protein
MGKTDLVGWLIYIAGIYHMHFIIMLCLAGYIKYVSIISHHIELNMRTYCYNNWLG